MPTQPPIEKSLVRTLATHANNFNFLRFALSSLVVLSHSFVLVRYRDPFEVLFGKRQAIGNFAVDGFFLISGYLIVNSWLNSSSGLSYLRKRCWRIYPGFLAAFALSLLVFAPLGGNPHYWQELAPAALTNLRVALTLGLPRTPAVFDGLDVPIVNGSLWTIRYEFLCYLAVIALGVSRILSYRALLLGLTVLCLVIYGLQLQTEVIQLGEGAERIKFFVPIPRLLSCFLVGACVRFFPFKFRFRGVIAAAVLFVGATRLGLTATRLAIPLAGGYCLFALANSPVRILRAWNSLPDVSYGLYLYAWPVQTILIHRMPSISPFALFLVSWPLSILLGALSWYGVERWFVRPQSRVAARGSA